MEGLLILLIIGFAVCYFIRHPLKSIKYAFCILTFLLVGCIVMIGLFHFLMIQLI